MEIKYRQGTLHDLDDIELLVKDAIAHMKRQGIEQWDDIYPIREDFQQDINQKQLFVGTVNDEIAVTYTINKEFDKEYENGQWKNPEKRFCILHRLCVNPKFQNKGIARKTVEQIEKEIVCWGEQAIRLDAYSKNPYALKLYQDAGYEKVGVAEFRKGTFYLMEKYLTSD